MTRLPAAVRLQVKQRANFCCEYCRIPEGFSFYEHQIDHIRSLKHRGSDELSNLACACFDCNNAKGSDIAGYDDDTSQIVALYNPRTQTWSDHFGLDGAVIVGLTSIGRVTAFC